MSKMWTSPQKVSLWEIRLGHKVRSKLVKVGTEEIGYGINLDDSRRGKGRKYSIDMEKKDLKMVGN